MIDTYSLLKQRLAQHVLASALAPTASNPDLLERVAVHGAGPDELFSIEFRAGDHVARVDVKDDHQQGAGTRSDEAGNLYQCCALRFNVSWRDRTGMALPQKQAFLRHCLAVARLAEELQAIAEAAGPTWQLAVRARDRQCNLRKTVVGSTHDNC